MDNLIIIGAGLSGLGAANHLKEYEIYFESPLDMENFFHFYNTTYGLNEIQK